MYFAVQSVPYFLIDWQLFSKALPNWPAFSSFFALASRVVPGAATACGNFRAIQCSQSPALPVVGRSGLPVSGRFRTVFRSSSKQRNRRCDPPPPVSRKPKIALGGRGGGRFRYGEARRGMESPPHVKRRKKRDLISRRRCGDKKKKTFSLLCPYLYCRRSRRLGRYTCNHPTVYDTR